MGNIAIFLKKYCKKWKLLLVESALFSLLFILFELFFLLTQHMEFSSATWYHFIFMIPLGTLYASICCLFKGKVNCILATIFASISGVWLLVQTCYHSVFQVYMEFSKITMAGDVAGAFGNETATAIIEAGWQILAIVLLVVAFSLFFFKVLKPKRRSPILCALGLLVTLILHLGCVGILGLNSKANEIYHEAGIIDNRIELFGYNTTLRLEFMDMLFGKENDDPGFIIDTGDPLNPIDTSETTKSVDDSSVTSGDEPVVPVKTKNIINVDFNLANSTETNETIKKINQYVNSLSGSHVNEYTGLFNGYNLIMICAESFSDKFISAELTPTLYKMSTNGFVFTNYYGMMKSITTNGEYAMLTGLIPQTSGSADELKSNSTFLSSVGKYLPFNMANVFNENGGFSCAYHGHSSTYYHRGETHLNLGYQLLRFSDKGIVNGKDDKTKKLSFSIGNIYPSSDYELAQQTLNDYLSNKDEDGNIIPFTAYYMTYSGHHPYYSLSDKEHKKNPQSWTMREDENGKWDKNSVIDQLPYNDVVKTYIACNMQVEMMVTEMLARLEEAGVLDKTVIVLTNDHYPYGLTDANFRNLAGQTVNVDFEIYRNAFICYNAGMEKPVTVNTPCSTVDILPTLLNLFGAEYDSRLLAGTDILDSKSFHIAMLYNKNFITDKIKYKNSTGKITYIADKSEVSDSYIQSCINYVSNKFEISLQIVNNDYYRTFFNYYNAQNK